MKLKDAQKIIDGKKGFRVTFQVHENSMLRSDHFPDIAEEPFPTEAEAWEYARKFARARTTTQYVNVYVIDGNNLPVNNYRQQMFNRYPAVDDR